MSTVKEVNKGELKKMWRAFDRRGLTTYAKVEATLKELHFGVNNENGGAIMYMNHKA